ncbi:hypothetical protein GWI33_005056 [Rhynchophorus ferrugineus]|uniref:Uncharacterized protein n=1 Tax=Rhynchophorus ferrugineus TaxID=354439 RepID=A0A834IHC6_RHYFE|nr:hypothetical protein GWI33_005056 [Rhynchophorus ferrugineus]
MGVIKPGPLISWKHLVEPSEPLRRIVSTLERIGQRVQHVPYVARNSAQSGVKAQISPQAVVNFPALLINVDEREGHDLASA